jgi:hypothetical protein
MTITQELIDAERVKFEAWYKNTVFTQEVKSNEEWMFIAWQAAISQHKAVQDGYVSIPRQPDKATFIGEFSIDVNHHCSACSFHGAQDDCEVCGGEIEYTQKHVIPWTDFKDIYKAIIAAAPSDSKALVESEPDKAYRITEKDGNSFIINRAPDEYEWRECKVEALQAK